MRADFEANFFTLLDLLDPASRIEVESACTPIKIPVGQTIYRQGDPAGTVYIVSEGVAEAITESPDGKQTRSIGFMRRGDFFGETSVLTGLPRLGSVRACDGLELLWIEKSMYISLLNKIPKLGMFFSRNLARRLYKTSTEAHQAIYTLDLTGNLRHFDLITLFHAISRMKLTGELHLNNAANELVGSYFFRAGRAEFGRFIHLEGIEAVWEGFMEADENGTFQFQVMDKPTLPFSEEHRIVIETCDLLTQGTEYREVYRALPEPLRKMENLLQRAGDKFAWTNPATQTIAEDIWGMIEQHPQVLSSIWRRLDYSSLTFLQVVAHLVATGLAELRPGNSLEPISPPLNA